ncbi:MAG: ATP-dependent sacrificial sulfur transferase LarE [Melioribacteraceae bacterium]|nr:ATP-dependent sacrificial sulfur transferase LarE [Melioribacteraceae bacterium]MCF8263189.1 ATP-dependent sacrificial sulfur transferase LarE [Melioribacteraceae bacterium]MCF8430323.1 ATP-dependent sacrificial sulfur transferase LarE [Melioribacteraceae bacterium]
MKTYDAHITKPFDDPYIGIQNKLAELKVEFEQYSKVMVALSGGVDSCLAAFLARKFLGKENCVAVISNSESLKQKDFEIAADFCKNFDIDYEVIYTEELSNPDYSANPTNRCYFCKTELYINLNDLVESKFRDFKIINGNNYSDLGDYRPGLSASKERNANSPFINCQITKDDIRSIAKYFELPVWDKPASPCLSSRFPYGETISAEKLKRVEAAENILNEFGFEEVRVRSFGNIARIEVPTEKIPALNEKFNLIQTKLIAVGYDTCEIDNEGFVSGKMNRAI